MTHPRQVLALFLSLQEYELEGRIRSRYGRLNGLPTVDLIELFGQFSETVAPFTYLDGGSTVPDLALIKMLARGFPGCRYLEVGTWRGESLANAAAVAAECISISLSAEQMLRQGWPKRYVETARVLSRGLPNVTHIEDDSRSVDFQSLGRMDLVFIDGDHSYEGVLNDTRKAFEVLRGEESVIVWHDYLQTPERNIRWQTFAGILDGVPREAHSHLYHVSNTLCAVYITRPLQAKHLEFPAMPNKVFSVSLSVGPLSVGSDQVR